MTKRLLITSSLVLATSGFFAVGAGGELNAPLRETTPAQAAAEVAIAMPAPAAGYERPARTLWMEVTAYCPCTKCCGPQAMGITASGLPVSHNGGKFVAADTSVLPFGSQLTIPGYDTVAVPVIDRGGAIKGHRLDVYFDSHQDALEWGRRWVMVTIEE